MTGVSACLYKALICNTYFLAPRLQPGNALNWRLRRLITHGAIQAPVAMRHAPHALRQGSIAKSCRYVSRQVRPLHHHNEDEAEPQIHGVPRLEPGKEVKICGFAALGGTDKPTLARVGQGSLLALPTIPILPDNNTHGVVKTKKAGFLVSRFQTGNEMKAV